MRALLQLFHHVSPPQQRLLLLLQPLPLRNLKVYRLSVTRMELGVEVCGWERLDGGTLHAELQRRLALHLIRCANDLVDVQGVAAPQELRQLLCPGAEDTLPEVPHNTDDDKVEEAAVCCDNVVQHLEPLLPVEDLSEQRLHEAPEGVLSAPRAAGQALQQARVPETQQPLDASKKRQRGVREHLEPVVGPIERNGCQDLEACKLVRPKELHKRESQSWEVLCLA
mmetsp:Transcript_23386/g.64878  ORF Transcript_23386/g.64878 Transcript_23386/m.64878 type:complete len:225 (+) Transcript_23386:644-1318(+)